jgi:hypothetical protein
MSLTSFANFFRSCRRLSSSLSLPLPSSRERRFCPAKDAAAAKEDGEEEDEEDNEEDMFDR